MSDEPKEPREPKEPKEPREPREQPEQPESERIRILRMIGEGKVSPEEGARLLEALGRSGAAGEPPPGAKRWVRIHIASHGGDQVNLRLPIGLLRLVSKFIPRGVTLGEHKLSAEELMSLIESGEGDIVHVGSKNGDQVVIRVE